MKRHRMPVACNLTSEELRARETNLLAEFSLRLLPLKNFRMDMPSVSPARNDRWKL
jgi:hypothetical protein